MEAQQQRQARCIVYQTRNEGLDPSIVTPVDFNHGSALTADITASFAS